jgi:hypothetical protein
LILDVPLPREAHPSNLRGRAAASQIFIAQLSPSGYFVGVIADFARSWSLYAA